MKTYEVDICIKATVEAYSEEDANEAVSDIFGTGEECGVNILDCSIKTIREQ